MLVTVVVTIAKVCSEEGTLLLQMHGISHHVSAVSDRVRGSGTSVQLVFLHEESLDQIFLLVLLYFMYIFVRETSAI